MSTVKTLKGKVIEHPKKLMIRSWRRVKIPDAEIVKALETNQAYFIAGLKRQTAHAVSKRLSKKVGFRVVAYSSIYYDERGYTFFREGIREWMEKAENSLRSVS